MRYFTNKCWLITYERSIPRYRRTYGIVAMFNYPKKAEIAFDKLVKEQSREDKLKCTYKLKEMDMDKPLTLFNYFY